MSVNHIYSCPTLWISDIYDGSHWADTSYTNRLKNIPPYILQRWTQENISNDTDSVWYRKFNDRDNEIFREAFAAGMPIMAGTDASKRWMYNPPGFSLHYELQMYVQNGLTPFQALQTATIHPAKYLGLEKEFGSIEQGKLADFILLNADPLVDINNTMKIAAVVMNGRLIARTELNLLLKQAEESVRRSPSVW
jgi:hypothetical protein